MADVFTQFYIQVILAVKNQESFITPEIQYKLYPWMKRYLHSKDHQTLAIGGMEDHVHLFFTMQPEEQISGLVQELKTESTRYMNQYVMGRTRFSWQRGYAAFSYGRSQRDEVINYILQQKVYHSRKTFRQEFEFLVNVFDVKKSGKLSFEFFDEELFELELFQ